MFTPQDERDAHCILRFRERYRMDVAPWFLRQLERLAKRGVTEIIGETRTNGVVHRHETDNKRVHFMIDRRTGMIVTVLDEAGAIAMAVRRECARGGRGEARAGHRGTMADGLDAIRDRLFVDSDVARDDLGDSPDSGNTEGDVPGNGG